MPMLFWDCKCPLHARKNNYPQRSILWSVSEPPETSVQPAQNVTILLMSYVLLHHATQMQQLRKYKYAFGVSSTSNIYTGPLTM